MNLLRPFALCLAVIVPVAHAEVSIATAPANYGFLEIYNLASSSAALGQTFSLVDSAHTRLDSFEFRMAQPWGGSPTADFSAYLFQWNSVSRGLTGAPLWTSALQTSITLSPPSGPGTVVTFDTGGIDLQPGQSYAAVLFDSTIGSSVSSVGVGYNGGGYPGNMILFGSNTQSMTFADLYTSAMMFSNDVAFGATFSAPDLTAVPEPATAFAGIGLAFVAGLVALRLHRRRRAAVAS